MKRLEIVDADGDVLEVYPLWGHVVMVCAQTSDGGEEVGVFLDERACIDLIAYLAKALAKHKDKV